MYVITFNREIKALKQQFDLFINVNTSSNYLLKSKI